ALRRLPHETPAALETARGHCHLGSAALFLPAAGGNPCGRAWRSAQSGRWPLRYRAGLIIIRVNESGRRERSGRPAGRTAPEPEYRTRIWGAGTWGQIGGPGKLHDVRAMMEADWKWAGWAEDAIIRMGPDSDRDHDDDGHAGTGVIAQTKTRTR